MADPQDITNWLRLDELTVTSGQPSEAQLLRVAALGVGYVVNLGLHTHKLALADEAGTVAALGMCYIHIPVSFEAPQEEDFNRFLAVLKVVEGVPLYVHCIMNARVSAFFYRYRREVLGWDYQTAFADMAKIWRPGGAWAAFIGDHAGIDRPHQYAGEDYLLPSL
ncbi:MAG: protein tyrosine phosphatase family protein [Rhodospirillales bacterium]|nr:protein tyrosine phosphatase family protein [Rhodospirillales bacterium]